MSLLNRLQKLLKKKPKIERIDITKRFNLVGRTGQGSMSKVWKALDTLSGRTVALKVLDKEKTLRFEARFPGLDKPKEGEIAVQLDHPNIVKTIEHGYTTDDEQFLVMEFIDGVGLSFLVDMQNDMMRDNRLQLMIELGDGISHFHDKKWIHRDICPRNIMVTSDAHAKLIDFGLVVPNTPEFRKPGNRTGTANYMAPELIKRQPTDQRIDIFSYSVTCYEMYTKRLPWESAMTLDAVLQHINKQPVPILELVPGLDEQIGNAIMKGLEKDPADRWQTIGKMTDEFRAAQERVGNREFQD